MGQATVEYILILSIATSLAIFVMKKFIVPTYSLVAGRIAQNIETKFSGANLYRFRVGR